MNATTIPSTAIEADTAKVDALLQTPEAQAILAELNTQLEARFPRLQPLEARFVGLVPGVKTSEFWSQVAVWIAAALTGLTGHVPAIWALGLATASTVAYSISRGLAKKGN